MPVNAVGNVNANYVNYRRDSLKQKKNIGAMMGITGIGTAAGAYFVKNNYVAIGLGILGLLGGLLGFSNSIKAGKELNELNKQQKLNTEI